MTAERTYQACGQVIASDIELPLATARSQSASIRLHAGGPTDLLEGPLNEDDNVIARYGTSDQSEPWYVVIDEGHRFRLRLRGTAEFLISRDLTEVDWIAVPEGRSELIPILFSGTVLALILTLQGRLVLHASAVAEDDGTLAFVGQSGRGKSTMAALCAAAGAAVVSDDVLLVELDTPIPRCCGNASELRLRPGARDLAERFSGAAATQRETADSRLGISPFDSQSGWSSLRSIVVPYPSREVTSVEIAPVTTSDALLQLLTFPRIEGISAPHIIAQQFHLHAQLARAVSVFKVIVPWGPPFQEQLGREILQLLKPSPAIT